MMRDLSLHILDIAENSIEAQATRVEIRLKESHRLNRLVLEIVDDGKGMDRRMLKQVLDPFVTTKKTRRFGLGLPLLAQAARAANGRVRVKSEPGRGTRVRAVFELGHIDLKPLGDMAQTLTALIMGHPEVDIVYVHETDRSRYELDTRELKRELDSVPVQSPEVISLIRRDIRDGLDEIRRQNESRKSH
jgi:signal transduction histidine kinase